MAGQLERREGAEELGTLDANVVLGQVQQLQVAGSPEHPAAATPDGGSRWDVGKRRHLARMTGDGVWIFLLSGRVRVGELEIRSHLAEVAHHVVGNDPFEHR